ncbi:class I SAM-dependent methyltransferase [Amylibacter sp. SFDW26]|uniref:class I SAM-dependent methyltransferase n=1 Tax=Amylibacter sp. SFDW26 TaxID=2652722 RepID=UPI0012615A0E|nr:methyltransferase domain-containing protein [Amylibacter sp. SFDW26]KAB7610458.1 class I SAM-dependent methyltransferase [Amylibacter sp. SFDW26]
MHLDVIKLRAFYYRTKLGRIVQRALREEIIKLWPDVKGQTVAGFGFAAPMLRPFLTNARRVMCIMPGPQGVMAWPEGKENHSVLTEETNWPISTGFVDKLIVLHGLETSENTAALLDEIWRVLGPGGRVLFIVPNRSGLWARRDATPFGYGRPYSLAQLEAQLQKHRFLPERHISALYAIPSHRPFGLKIAQMLEGFSLKVAMPFAAGVVMVEATKQVYAPTHKGLGAAVRKPLEALEGIAKPASNPVSNRSKSKNEEQA